MKKKDKIQDSPEFEYYKADFENFVKGMEEDKESADLKIPDGWEQDFEKTIDDTLDENERKRKRRIVKRIAGVAAAVVLVVGVGNFTAESVSGEGLLEMFSNVLHLDGNQQIIYGNGNEVEIDAENGEEDILFSGSTLSEVNEQIRQEIKKPMLYLNYVPEGFEIVDARYSRVFRVISIELSYSTNHIFVFQNQQVEETAVGIQSKEEEVDHVFNKYINQEIFIYKNMQDEYLTFKVEYGDSIISIHSLTTLEMCKKMAENIEYK